MMTRFRELSSRINNGIYDVILKAYVIWIIKLDGLQSKMNDAVYDMDKKIKDRD